MCLDELIPPLGAPLEGVERIAVLRANGLGDYLFAEPALRSLKAAYPSAELTLVGAPWHADTLPFRSGPVDRVVVAPALPGVREPEQPGSAYAGRREVDAFFDRMRSRRFDLAVQMHGGGRNSNPFVSRMGARTTVGSATSDAEKPDRWLPFNYYQPELIRFLELASLAGAPPVTFVARWDVTAAERAEVARLLGASDGGPLVALCPGAGDPRRRWPTNSFARVAAALAPYGARFAITGSPSEVPLGARLAEEALSQGVRALDLTGRLSLGGLSALLERCVLAVANDSGTLHLARAVGTPTVAVYWCGNLINAGPLAHARHRTHLSWRLACPECGADCTRVRCGHDPSFVAEVDADDIVADCLDLLEREGRL